jgi:prevent-host-death family protein
MKDISAGKFKDQCLKIMDTVARTKTPIIVSKRKKPIVKVVPYASGDDRNASLEGSILKERGDPFRTGERWDADLP